MIFNDFNQIKEDTQLLPMIFRAEAAVRTKALEAQKDAENEKKEAVARMGSLQQKIDNLEQDKNKAKQLSIKAIAARSKIKEYLDDEKNKVNALQQQMALLQHKLIEAEQERLDFQNKHDEMFNSVSALNQRIEELESHKLHLLSKLKGYGDKGGLEYIVKTQKLDKIESKQFENRVTVEQYDPQAARDAAEAEAKETMKRMENEGGDAKPKKKAAK